MFPLETYARPILDSYFRSLGAAQGASSP